ncbi:hypothetical protein AKO1_014132 [Acrasis kona]|uniref:Rab-GAP TBC domain-containing protein n=1 Tax=Acrasis kona TaxID=1008807 RepID=A0AAW2Z095_9EUKA
MTFHLEWYLADNINMSKKTSQNGFLPLLSKMARRGLHNSTRATIWKQIIQNCFNSVTGPCYTMLQGNTQQPLQQILQQHQQLYSAFIQRLRDDITKRRLLSDAMVHNDVKRTSDDENYFVFEDLLDHVMIIFSRDVTVHRDCQVKPVSLIGVTDAELLSEKTSSVTNKECYPPNGITPFEGISMVAAPFCYVGSKADDVYYLFRHFYTRYFCGLHVISSHQESIIPLCKCFEDILMESEPQLFYHMLQIQVNPLEIAYSWIFQAFVGYLSTEQLFLLWDRIVGFDTLLIVPVFAASLFTFRSSFLLNATTKQDVIDVFSDFTIIKVVPLLQLFLFQ